MAKLANLGNTALEVLVDIARTIGAMRLASGEDSRDDWRMMCEWADEFQAGFESSPGAMETYYEGVEEFAIKKAAQAGWTACNPQDQPIVQVSLNGTELALIQAALEEYRELISSPTSADRDSRGGAWADQEVNSTNALLHGKLADAFKMAKVPVSEELQALGFQSESHYRAHQRLMLNMRALYVQQKTDSIAAGSTAFPHRDVGDSSTLPPIGKSILVRVAGVVIAGVVTGHGSKDGKPTFGYEYEHHTLDGLVARGLKWAWPEQLVSGQERPLQRCFDNAQQDAFKKLQFALSQATDCGLLDLIAADAHPERMESAANDQDA